MFNNDFSNSRKDKTFAFDKHVYKAQELEPHHKDPFDRLIIAQAISEGFRIVSSDNLFDEYVGNRI